MVGCNGYRWGVVFLVSDMRLSQEERDYVTGQAIQMKLKRIKERKIRTDFCEGVITTKGREGILGSFTGRHYVAELETEHGKSRLSFLVTEYINAVLN